VRPLGLVAAGLSQRTAARAARAEGDVMRPTCRCCSTDAALMCPELLRVDFREGLPLAELSSTGPPRLSLRLAKLWGDVPTPSRSVVSILSSRLGLRSFLGRGGLLCRSSSAMYSSAFVAIRSLFLSGAEIGSLRRDVTASERCERPSHNIG
jgi:hypothetical protein